MKTLADGTPLIEKSLLLRAQKRTAIRLAPTLYKVLGEQKFGDTYPAYVVRKVAGRWVCTCQGHMGGEYRTVCSHIVAAVRESVQIRSVASEVQAPSIPIQNPREPLSEPLPFPQDARFGQPPIPAKFHHFRPVQWQAVQEILAAFRDPAIRVVLVDAPVGSGKTLLAETVRRLLTVSRRALYICTTKGLQDQIVADFPYAERLKGRANYPTADYPEKFHVRWEALTAADCTAKKDIVPACGQCAPDEPAHKAMHCKWCHPVSRCPYNQAKQRALAARLSVLNTAYFLTEANGPGKFRGWPLVILDEADILEQELMGHVEARISPKLAEKLAIAPPPKKTVMASWGPWLAEECLPKLQAWQQTLYQQPEEPKVIRQRKHADNLVQRFKGVQEDVDEGLWVYTGYQQGEIAFKPITVSQWADDLLWQHGERFVVMSGTLISPKQFAHDVGLEEGHWTTVSVASQFPADRRPVYLWPVANMAHSQGQADWPVMAAAIQRIVHQHQGENVLVHTVSYEWTRYLAHQLTGTVLTYQNGSEREAILAEFKRQHGAVLLAPSMDRGVDLPDDLCRVIVISKVPFPNLGDKQVSARLHQPGGSLWYQVQTVRTIVQMTGRGMRHAQDWCVTYVLDSQFGGNVWRKSRLLFPAYWREAVQQRPPDWTRKEGMR